jgi:hypothetical protein
MGRATFKGHHRPAGTGRSLRKPAMYMLGFCCVMAGAVGTAERFFGDGSGGLTGWLTPEDAAAGALSGLVPGGLAPEQKPASVLITPTGELTPEQRAWLLEQARSGAPIPLDAQTGEPEDPKAAREKKLELIGRALDGG